ncbi:sugar kinase [Candidatus Woesearchaeota archaeon]|jgi:sugar/nucleoside kinase (ribokinase family)|nr:sugar kinase [Candidatus Woesearchaeota archaeon]
MAKTIIIGSIGLDDVKTPFGDMKAILGGSAVYASYASSFFTNVGIVSIAGEDFPEEYKNLLTNKNIDMSGIEFKGKTFRWSGEYEYDMNEAKTLNTELNSITEFSANLPESYKNAEYILLGNIDPELQLKVIEQLSQPKLIAMDTMNFWIESKKEHLIEVIKKVDLLLINDGEARLLFETVNLLDAGNKALNLGPKYVIIKKGEHGALLFTQTTHFSAPGYPLEVLKDPTGCGDSFAGGLIGWLAKTDDISEPNLRKAIIYGSTIASFNAEDFSLERQKTLNMEEINKRFQEFEKMREF